MDFVKKNGLNSFFRFYIAFQIVTIDSGYVEVEIEVRDLRGYYNDTQKTIVYDSFSGPIRVSDMEIPKEFILSQNYPNPFNPATTIKYQLLTSSYVFLKIYDLLGREIAELVNEYKIVGDYEVKFNAGNLPSGIYFYKLRAGNFVETKKMSLMK